MCISTGFVHCLYHRGTYGASVTCRIFLLFPFPSQPKPLLCNSRIITAMVRVALEFYKVYLTHYGMACIDPLRENVYAYAIEVVKRVRNPLGSHGNLMSIFLTSDELVTLTGKRHKSSQIAWLRNSGIPFYVNASGRPVVTRSAIEGGVKKGTIAAPAAWQPAVR